MPGGTTSLCTSQVALLRWWVLGGGGHDLTASRVPEQFLPEEINWCQLETGYS